MASIAFRDKVLKFWFDKLTPVQWFNGGVQVDEMVRDSFEADYLRAKQGEFDDLHTIDAQSSLALVIALDQFPRNMYRGSAEAFATDAKALQLVYDGLERKYGEELKRDSDSKAQFYLLPLMHAEDVAAQNHSCEYVAKFELSNLDFANQHRDTILKFNRFPYRNEALCRESTPEEEEFLKTASFP